jgi:toxin ParE1/3/4
MAEINWTLQAIEDIDNIADYIAKDSLKYASLQVERIFNHAEILAKKPEIGRVVPEINNNKIRELILGNYRIIYKVINKNRIDILTVHHSARLIKNSPAFRKRK